MKNISILFSFLFVALFCNAQQAEYTGGSAFSSGFARVESKGRSFYIDTAGGYAFDSIIENCHLSQDDDSATGLKAMYKVVKKGKQGVVDNDGRWVLQPEYDRIDTYFKDMWGAIKKGKLSLYTASGFILPFLFEDLQYLNERYITVQHGGKWGLYSIKEQKLLIPVLYDSIAYCKENCARTSDLIFAKKNGKWGVINFQNKEVIPFNYDDWGTCYSALTESDCEEWHTSLRGEKALINLYTKKVICVGYDDCKSKMEFGLTKVMHNGKFGLLNARGTLVLDFIYDDITLCKYQNWKNSSFLIVSKNEQYGVVDSTGRVILSPEYDEHPYLCENLLFVVKDNGKIGIADTSGNVIVPPIYEELHAWGDLYVARLNDKEMLYTKASPLLPQPYDEIKFETIKNEGDEVNYYPYIFSISQEGKKGFYNARTKKLVAPQYDEIRFDTYEEGGLKYLFSVEQNGKTGFVDRDGNVIMPPLYCRDMKPLEGYPSLVQVTLDSSYGIFDLTLGREVVPTKYASIVGLTKYTSIHNIGIAGKTADAHLLLQREANDRQEYSLFDSDTKKSNVLPYAYVFASDEPGRLVVVRDSASPTQMLNVYTGKIVPGQYDTEIITDNDEKFIQPGISLFRQEKAVVWHNKKAGVINTSGDIVVPMEYDDIGIMENGHIQLFKNKFTEEKKGEVLYGLKDSTRKLTEAHQSEQMLYGIADSTGKIIVPIEYDFDDSATEYGDYALRYYGFLLLRKEKPLIDLHGRSHSLWGLADEKGNVVIPPIYDEISIDKEHQGFIVRQGKKFSVLDKNGKNWMAPVYDGMIHNKSYSYFDYVNKVTLTFPLMVKQGNTYRYIRADGSTLPIRIKKPVPFLRVPKK